MSDERYRELPNMTYCGIGVGRVGAPDIFFLRAMAIKWDDLEAQVIVRAGEVKNEA